MDRPTRSGNRSWSVLIVPRGPAAGIHRLDVDDRSLWRLRLALAGVGSLAVVLGVVLVLALPRIVAYPSLIDDNLAMRTQLRSIDRELASLDELLLRLKTYEAQLRGVTGDGGHGPVDMSRRLGGVVGADATPWSDDSGEVVAQRTSRAEDLAAEVGALRSVLSVAEGDLRGLVGEALALKALEEALPSSWPAQGFVSSEFGYRRSPFGRRWRFHSGLDIAGDRGAPVKAAGPGVVIRAEYHSGYGRMVEIDHGFGIVSVYGHCHRLRVRAGDVVERGQLIATMGSTGRSTGDHLHFEVRFDGHSVDPMDLLVR